MPAKIVKSAKRTVTYDARPDRPDIRDRIYMPPLQTLPPQSPSPKWIKSHLPKYVKAKLVLDQGEEGACTGFGLAGVINYLLYRQSVIVGSKTSPLVSPRMIYHLARKYDEWRGQDYEGSSCRGAIKGWFHHGVCTEALWPYRDKAGVARFMAPSAGWDADAAQRPVGAYYRILTDAIADLQGAINEVGAIYVSSDVHKGWDAIGDNLKSLPTIPWKPGVKVDGGHAFALVGYDLIHKAVGWALREAGKVDQKRLERYLRKNVRVIPRTTFRYAIERFPLAARRELLAIERRS